MTRGLFLADLVTIIGTQDLVFVRLIVSFLIALNGFLILLKYY